MKQNKMEATDWLIKGISPKKLAKEKKRAIAQRNREKIRLDRWGGIIERLFCRQHKICYKKQNN